MSSYEHDTYLNAYAEDIRRRTKACNRDMLNVDRRWPVRGGYAYLSQLEIETRQRDKNPFSAEQIARGVIVCNHLWKAQGPGSEGQYFCTGWIKYQSCVQGRNAKDGLDCGFRFTADEVSRRA